MAKEQTTHERCGTENSGNSYVNRGDAMYVRGYCGCSAAPPDTAAGAGTVGTTQKSGCRSVERRDEGYGRERQQNHPPRDAPAQRRAAGAHRPDSREIDLAIAELEFRESGYGLYAKPAAHTIRGPYAGVRKGASPTAQRNGVYSKHSFCV